MTERTFSTTPHDWICPSCRRVIQLVYRPVKPLPCCMGRLHPKQMLVSSNYDEYWHCFARHAAGEALGKPLIQNRNAHRFGVRPGPYLLRELGEHRVTERT